MRCDAGRHKHIWGSIVFFFLAVPCRVCSRGRGIATLALLPSYLGRLPFVDGCVLVNIKMMRRDRFSWTD